MKYPAWVCHACAIANGGKYPKGHVSTCHENICDVCKKRKVVTSPRDYGYPKFKKGGDEVESIDS